MKLSKKLGSALFGGLLVTTAIGYQATSYEHHEAQEIQELNTELPAGIKGDRMRAYFSAYENRDPEEYGRWLKENRTERAFNMAPLEARVRQFEMGLEMFGAWTIVQVEEPEPNRFEVLVQEADHGEFRKVVFVFEEEAPFKIGPMALEPSMGPGQEMAFDFPWQNLEDFIDQYRDQSGLPGVALGVIKDGDVVDISARGQRLVGGPENIELDDKFHWGSLTKSVTGTMIGKLIEDGVLDWDTTVGEVLGDMEMRDEYRSAKLWQVMGHQARFPGYGDIDEDMAGRFQAYSGTETERRGQFIADLLLEEPVRVGVYSNAGLTVAGYMAEVATGRTWRQLVQEHLFDAIGMETAGFGWPVTKDDPNQPQGHFGNPANYEPMPVDAMEELIRIMSPAGDVHSSIGDMLKYGQFHLDGMAGKDGYLKAETVQGLHTPRPGQEPVFGEHYTFGWGHWCPGMEDVGACQRHNGSGGSYFAELQLYPEQNMATAYLTNAFAPAEFYSAEVFRALYDKYSR